MNNNWEEVFFDFKNELNDLSKSFENLCKKYNVKKNIRIEINENRVLTVIDVGQFINCFEPNTCQAVKKSSPPNPNSIDEKQRKH